MYVSRIGVSEGVEVLKSTVAEPSDPAADKERIDCEDVDAVAVMVIVAGFKGESSLIASSKLVERMIAFNAIASLANGISSLLIGSYVVRSQVVVTPVSVM